MREAPLGLDFGRLEDGDPGPPRAGPGRGRYSQQRLERRWRLATVPQGRVDVPHHGRGVRGDEAHDLGGIQAGASTDADEAVESALHCKIRRLLKRLQGRFDVDVIEYLTLDAFLLQNLPDLPRYASADHSGI